jgi:hypothetical protein
MFMGGALVPEITSYGAGASVSGDPAAHYPGQNVRWVIETGNVYTGGSGGTVLFDNTYTNLPLVIHTPMSQGVNPQFSVTSDMDTSGFTVDTFTHAGNRISNTSVAWISFGTVVF